MALRQGIISGDRVLTQAQLQEQVLRAAAGLSALGVGQQDAVAILMRNDTPFLVATFAANRLGAYAVPVNWHFKAAEVAYILTDSGATVLVAHADLYHAVADVIPPGVRVVIVPTPADVLTGYGIRPDAAPMPARHAIWDDFLAQHPPAQRDVMPSGGSILYTSGTTGKPKGVRRTPPTPEQVAVQTRMGRIAYNAVPGVRSIIPGPLYHSAPISYATRTTPIADLTVIMARFDPIALLESIERDRIEQMFAVPTMFVRLLKLPDAVRAKYDVSSLKFVMHAAAPCPPNVKRAMIEWWGPVIWEFYGGTESGAVTVCNAKDWLRKPGTVGRPVDGAEVAIYDDAGHRVPVGEIGEVFCRIHGLNDFTYQGKAEARAKIERDGLITCGDVGYLDADGYLFLCDRKRDMVISGGVNIYPAEIEAVLLAMPEVADGCVFGIPDDEYGEKLHAVVQPAAGATVDATRVRRFLAEHLANYKVPATVEFKAELPREDTGKIFKRLLREPHWAGRDKRI